MIEALTMDVLATDLADYLVRKGVSYSTIALCSICYINCRYHSVKHITYPVAQSRLRSPENAS